MKVFPPMEDTGVEQLLAEGDRLLRSGDFAAAEAAFARALALAPDSAVTYSKLGAALAQQGRLDEALDALSRAVALQPTYAPAYNNLGNVYREKGMVEQALAAYRRAVELDPDYWLAHQNLGALYRRMGRFDDAVRHFKIAHRLSLRRPPGPSAGPARPGCLPVVVAVVALAAAVALR